MATKSETNVLEYPQISEWAENIVPGHSIKGINGQYVERVVVHFEPVYAVASTLWANGVPFGWLIDRTDWMLHGGELLVSSVILVRANGSLQAPSPKL